MSTIALFIALPVVALASGIIMVLCFKMICKFGDWLNRVWP